MNDFPRTPLDLLRIASLPFVYLALGIWYVIAVPFAVAVVAVIATLLALAAAVSDHVVTDRDPAIDR